MVTFHPSPSRRPARDDFAQIMDELDLGEVLRPPQPKPTRLAKGAPNRDPEHERKRKASSQQDADDNSAMPTAECGIGDFYHWFRGTDITRDCNKFDS